MNPNRLARTFEEAYGNAHSDFYRSFYAARGFTPPTGFPRTLAEWIQLPLLTKADIAAVPLERRTFVPKEDVLFYRTSSGTTNRGVVIIPRNLLRDFSDRAHLTTRMLEFHSPHHFPHVSSELSGTTSIAGDRSDLPATAKLAAHFGADGISVTASILMALIPHLSQTMSASDIRYIYLWGERVSPEKRDLFAQTFPNAYIEADYGLSELHGVGGYGCEEMMWTNELYVHPHSELIYWELIDPASGMPAADEGEVVITTLWNNNAFPGLRYRTGDIARRVNFPCACNRDSYEILGRAAHDRAAVPGGLITSTELERALFLYRDHIEDDFELHIYGNETPPRLELRVRPKAGVTLDPETVAIHISTSVRISPQSTLEDSVRLGLVGTMKCVLLPVGDVHPGKQLRIFAH